MDIKGTETWRRRIQNVDDGGIDCWFVWWVGCHAKTTHVSSFTAWISVFVITEYEMSDIVFVLVIYPKNSFSYTSFSLACACRILVLHFLWTVRAYALMLICWFECMDRIRLPRVMVMVQFRDLLGSLGLSGLLGSWNLSGMLGSLRLSGVFLFFVFW